MTPPPPPRAQVLWASSLSAVGGGALVGLAEALRVVLAGRLHLSGGEVAGLCTLGVLTAASLGLLPGLLLGVGPRRPLGRVRWSGLLVGVAAPLVARLSVWWFSDPPPFTDPLPGQGNPLYFLVGLLGVGLLLGIAYQAARGARVVIGATLGVAVALGAWVVSGESGPETATHKPPPGAPNVLLVTLDTTRADHMGAMGGEVDTRAFDAIARDGALFRNASAVAAVTGPSHASMLTGAGPWEHGVLLNGVPIPPDRTTVAEVLHDYGWNTGAFVSSYVLDGEKGFSRGFEVYDDDFGWLKGSGDLVFLQLAAMARRHFNPDEELERRAGDTVDAALAWMNKQEGATFTWVHLFDAHGPYLPPPPYDTRYYSGDPRDPGNTSMNQVQNVAGYLKKSLAGITDVNWVFAEYSGEIAYADAQMGRLLTGTDPKTTLVIVIGDHGESLGEHGVWFNHGDDVYETSLHVPFAVRWSGHVPAGTEIVKPFEGTDLAPTILDMVGVEAPSGMTGVSVGGLLSAGRGQGRELARSMCFDREANVEARAAGKIDKPKWRMVGIRGQTSRYVQRETGKAPEYYDLTADPKGLDDVLYLVQQTEQGNAQTGYFKEKADELMVGNATERSAMDVGEEERKRLEALGYLDGTSGP